MAAQQKIIKEVGARLKSKGLTGTTISAPDENRDEIIFCVSNKGFIKLIEPFSISFVTFAHICLTYKQVYFRVIQVQR